MANKARSYIPEGYHTLTPYLIVRGAEQAIEYYKKAFNAAELYRMPMPDGRIGHAEIRIGDSVVMLADEMLERNIKSPSQLGGAGVGFHVYVENCDAVFKQALAAGGKQVRELADQFYGDRTGTLLDPFGHQWTVATHKEDLTAEEINQRMAQQRPK